MSPLRSLLWIFVFLLRSAFSHCYLEIRIYNSSSEIQNLRDWVQHTPTYDNSNNEDTTVLSNARAFPMPGNCTYYNGLEILCNNIVNWINDVPTSVIGLRIHNSNSPQIRTLHSHFLLHNRLQMLCIYKTNLQYIEDSAFSGLPSLEVLHIDSTHLSSFSWRIFAGCNNLKFIDMPNNRINFTDSPLAKIGKNKDILPSLQHIRLDANPLDSITDEFIALKGNQLEELSLQSCSIRHLKTGKNIHYVVFQDFCELHVISVAIS